MWKNRVNCALKGMDNQKQEWNKYLKAYEGEILTPEYSDFSSHFEQPNLFYVDVRSSLPKLYSQSPYFYFDPDTPEADLSAELMEKVVNSIKDKKWFLKKRAREWIVGAKLKGRAYLKVSYKFEKADGEELVGDEPNDEILIQYVDREDLIVDPNACSVDSARWVAHKIKAPISEIRRKFNLKSEDKISSEEDQKDYLDGEKVPSEERDDFQYGTYFEIEDRSNHELSYIVSGLDGFAEKPKEMPYGYFSMYTPLEWNRLPKKLDTKADLHFWWGQLVNLAETKTQQAHHRRKLNSKYKKIGPTPLKEEQIDDLTSYDDGTVVDLGQGNDVVPFQHAQLGQEVYLGEQSLRQDIAIISGMNEMKQGVPQSQKTAREAMAIVQESQDVVSDRVGLIEEALESVMAKCVWLMQNFYDTTRMVSLSGMEEVEFLGYKEKYPNNFKGTADKPFVEFVGKRDLLGKMSISIKAGSSMPTNEAQRKQDLIEFLGLIKQAPQLISAIDPKEVLKEGARIFHIENKGIIFDPKTPEQENALLKRNVPVMPHYNESHEQHIAGHERENNGSPAFIAHILNHKLMKAFIEQSQLNSPAGPTYAQPANGELSQENISGFPQGSSVPPEALPQQQASETVVNQQASSQSPQFQPNF